MKFRKKPVEVDAFRWTGGPDQEEDPEWVIEAIKENRVAFLNPWGTAIMIIFTPNGALLAKSGDYIIHGVDGGIHPCRADIFEMTYEAVEWMNYDEIPTRKKEASDGEKARRCWCSGRCVVHYDENRWYRVECEHCGDIMTFKAPSHDFAIKMWNDMPDMAGLDDSTKRNYDYRKEIQRDNDLRIFRNFINHMTKAYRARTVNWAVVQDILMAGTYTAGSTSSIAKCREIGIDPWGYTMEQVKEAGDGLVPGSGRRPVVDR